MKLKILCFEDNLNDAKNLEASFIEKGHQVDFLHYDLNEQWDEKSERAKGIANFDPDLAIVDLADELGSRRKDSGFRLIRKLRELQESGNGRLKGFPIIAWSKLLKRGDAGNQIRQKTLDYGAIPIFKPRRKRFGIAEMLRKAKLQ